MEPIQFRKKMRIVSGLPCIYHLGLATLYSEQVKEDGDSYIFDPEKTVYLVFDRVKGREEAEPDAESLLNHERTTRRALFLEVSQCK